MRQTAKTAKDREIREHGKCKGRCDTTLMKDTARVRAKGKEKQEK